METSLNGAKNSFVCEQYVQASLRIWVVSLPLSFAVSTFIFCTTDTYEIALCLYGHSHSQTWAFVARLQNQWLLWNSDEQRQLILPFDFHENKLYNIDPLKPHFYIVKLGFTGVCIIFLISAQKHRLWVLVRTASPRRF